MNSSKKEESFSEDTVHRVRLDKETVEQMRQVVDQGRAFQKQLAGQLREAAPYVKELKERLMEMAPHLKAARLATSEWPPVSEERGRMTPKQVVEEMWAFCGEIVEEHGRIRALPLLEKHEQFYARQFEAAASEREQSESPASEELQKRALSYEIDYRFKLRTLRRFMRRFAMTLEAPELSEEDQDELLAHERTLEIGEALIQYQKENSGELPDTDGDGRPFHGSKELFKKWAGGVICRGKSTVYNALRNTGCYRANRMTDKQEVEQVVNAVIDYAWRHSDRLNKSD